MRICRYDIQGQINRLGLVEGDRVRDVSAALDLLPSLRWPFPPGDLLIAHLDAVRQRIEAIAGGAPSNNLVDVTLRAPVANPSKIICGAGNWPEHREAMGGKTMADLGYLYKTTNALAGADDGVTLSHPDRTTVHEAELAIVIGRGGRHIAAAAALDHVAGYMIGLDMTMQGPENFTHNKNFDSYGVVGPWLVTADEIPDPGAIGFEFHVNGELRQKDSFDRLVFGVPALIEYAASVMTLYSGDIIMTGTPVGVAPVVSGDVMEARFDIIGTMRVQVRAAG